MHVLMLSMDTTLLTQTTGNARERHEYYAAQLGRISLVLCNRCRPGLAPYESERVTARPTQSRNYAAYLLDGYRAGLKFHAECPVDLIAVQEPFLTALIGLALRRRLHVPLLIQDHSCFVENPYFANESPRNRLLQPLARWTLRRADAVRVVNHAEEAACMRLGIPADRVCTIPIATHIAHFTRPATAEQIGDWYDRLGVLGIDPDAPLVLWVGRPVPVKNMPALLRVFARVHAEMPGVRFVIAGDTAGTALPAQIAALGLSSDTETIVALPGPVAHDDLPTLYQIASVYAHASNYEGFGLVLAEAGAAGLPVVSTDTDGARDIILDGQTGYLIPVGDDAALAESILDLLRNPERAEAMGARAREYVQAHFAEQPLLDAWVHMLKAAATGEPPCVS